MDLIVLLLYRGLEKLLHTYVGTDHERVSMLVNFKFPSAASNNACGLIQRHRKYTPRHAAFQAS